jgi:large subunit ribosomal protein L21
MPYVIIEQGGKQYRVEKGDSVVVDRVDAKQGSRLAPRALLYSDSGEKTLLDSSELAKVKVEAVVAEHLKGEKLRVFTYRPKKRHKRAQGHRSLLTRLEIADISIGGSERKSAAKPKEAPAAESEGAGKGGAARGKQAAAAKKDEGEGARKAAPRKAAAEKQDSKESA